MLARPFTEVQRCWAVVDILDPVGVKRRLVDVGIRKHCGGVWSIPAVGKNVGLIVSCNHRFGVRRYSPLAGHRVLYEGFRTGESLSSGYPSARVYTWACGKMMPLAGSEPSQWVREARGGKVERRSGDGACVSVLERMGTTRCGFVRGLSCGNGGRRLCVCLVSWDDRCFPNLSGAPVRGVRVQLGGGGEMWR
jgi:hypothetical protein